MTLYIFFMEVSYWCWYSVLFFLHSGVTLVLSSINQKYKGNVLNVSSCSVLLFLLHGSVLLILQGLCPFLCPSLPPTVSLIIPPSQRTPSFILGHPTFSDALTIPYHTISHHNTFTAPTNHLSVFLGNHLFNYPSPHDNDPDHTYDNSYGCPILNFN